MFLIVIKFKSFIVIRIIYIYYNIHAFPFPGFITLAKNFIRALGLYYNNCYEKTF